MKLNPDCIRDILITVEEIEYNSNLYDSTISRSVT